MALFKPFRGTRAALDSQELHDGYAYFCTDDGSFHIDYVDSDGNLQRKQINAKDAETLTGMSLDEIKNTILDLAKTYTDTQIDSHNHNDTYYTEAEIDSKISAVNTSINNITNGNTTVAKAEEATHTTSADSATTATTATKLGSSTVGSSTQPIYLNSGTATKVSYVGTAYGGTGATTVAGARTNLEVYSKSEVDSALSGKASTSHNHDTAYDTKGAAADVQENLDTVSDELDSHTSNTDVHVTTSNKSNWNTAYTHSQAAHAPSNAQPNQNAFSNIAVDSTTGSTTIAADSTTDTITLVAGSNVTITPDATNDKITIAATDTTYSAAGSSLGLVKSGGDVTISNGEITVNDDSHNHTIANIDGLQGLLDEKQETIIGGATTIVTSNLTASRALVSNGSGKVAVSDITSTELGYLDGVTSNVQEQLDGINEDVGGSIKDLSVSGKVITYTRNDGSTGTITTQDTDTNTKVTNTLNTTAKAYITGTTSSSTNTGTQVFDTGVYLDTTAGQLVATTFKGALDGNAKTATSATSATSATKATQDASGNVITSTYETKTDASAKLTAANKYTDDAISDLINSAPTTLDTLGEIATAMEANAEVVEALDQAIGNKSNSGHTHTVTHKPAGSVSSSFTGSAHSHTFTGSAATSGKPDTTNVTTIYSITGVGSLPSATLSQGTLPSHSYTAPSHSYTAPSLSASVSNKCLTFTFSAGSHSFSAGSHSFSAGSLPSLTFSAGSLPTRSSVISMPNANHTHDVTAAGTISDTTAGGSVSSSFTGTSATLTTSADS